MSVMSFFTCAASSLIASVGSLNMLFCRTTVSNIAHTHYSVPWTTSHTTYTHKRATAHQYAHCVSCCRRCDAWYTSFEISDAAALNCTFSCSGLCTPGFCTVHTTMHRHSQFSPSGNTRSIERLAFSSSASERRLRKRETAQRSRRIAPTHTHRAHLQRGRGLLLLRVLLAELPEVGRAILRHSRCKCFARYSSAPF